MTKDLAPSPILEPRASSPARTVRLVVLATLLGLGLLALPSTAEAGWEGTWGVRATYPQIVSVSGGLLIGEIEPRNPPAEGTTHLPHGLLVQLEPGLGGGKIGIGYAKGLLPYAAGGVKAVALRTWGHPWRVPTGQTYVGIEADASFFIKLSLGVLWRASHDVDAPKVLVTGGVGLGF